MVRLRLFVILSGLILTASSSLSAQGSIQGSVTDSLNKEALVGANIFLKGTAIGGISDIEGNFRVTSVPAGTYTVRFSYLGYKTKEVSVTVRDGAPVSVNATLLPDVIEGQEVVITAQARGQLSAINQQIKATTMVNVVSEEKIKELPDANAAEAIGRLPGVSLIRSGGEANKVILRGMSDKYAKVTIDGVGIATTDSNARGIDLSMIAQGTLSGIELYKSLTPDRDADAIAGSINLVTKRAPSERDIRIDAKGNYNRLKPTYDQYDFSGFYGERFFDDVLGIQITGNLEQKDRSSERLNVNYDYPAREQGTERELDWGIDDVILTYTDEERTRNGLSFFLDVNTPDSGVVRFNNSYSGTQRNVLTNQRDYPNGASDLISNSNGVSYIYRYSENTIETYNSSLRGENHLLGLDIIWGLSFSQSESTTPFDIELQFSETSNPGVSGMKTIPGSIYHGPPELFMEYAYNNFEKATLAWGFFNNKNNREQDRTAYLDLSKKYVIGDVASGDLKFGGKYRSKNRVKNSMQEFSPYYAQQYNMVRLGDGSAISKDSLYKGTRFQNLQMDGSLVKFTNFIGSAPRSRSIFGNFLMNPLINKDDLVEWYKINKNGFGTVEEFANNPIEYGNYYDVTEGVTAGYIMNTSNFGDIVTMIVGVRVEKEENEYNTRYSTKTVTGFPVPQGEFDDTTTTYSETNVLPHLHLTFRPTDFMNIRFAAYKALARPDFNARLANLVADASSGMLVLSNPNLRSAKAWNYEVNTTIYGGVLGMISMSAFYKEIEDLSNTTNRMFANNNPMTNGQTFFDSLGINYRNIFPANNTTLRVSVPYNSSIPAKVWGFEFDHQANLNFLPGYLQFIVLSYNFSLIRSEQHTLTWHTYTVNDTVIDPFFGPVVTTRNVNYYNLEKNKLFNQPEFFGNVAIGYDIGDLSTRLSLFYQGSFPRSYSADGRNQSLTDAFNRWDLSVKYNVTEYASVLFNVNNLNDFEESASTNHMVEPYWNLQTSRLRYGLTADLGVRIDL